MQPLLVKTSSQRYLVKIGEGILEKIGDELISLHLGKHIAVIYDEAVKDTHAKKVCCSLEKAGFSVLKISIPSGEASKDLSFVESTLSALAQNRMDRNASIVAVGGGVIGDMAGFVAAIYLRGIKLIHVPTTLLAMVDSSIGGKTGVNLEEGKNLVGAFHQPILVVADTQTLETLPEREYTSGLAEVIKYGIIADPRLFEMLEVGFLKKDLFDVLERCTKIKAKIVSADEYETFGQRALLNFGHTIGHAIENSLGYGTLLHGEAVAIGMKAAAWLSHWTLSLKKESVLRIESAISSNALPLSAKVDREKILSAMKVDKKVKKGKNQWVLSARIGTATLHPEVSDDDVVRAIDLCLS